MRIRKLRVNNRERKSKATASFLVSNDRARERNNRRCSGATGTGDRELYPLHQQRSGARGAATFEPRPAHGRRQTAGIRGIPGQKKSPVASRQSPESSLVDVRWPMATTRIVGFRVAQGAWFSAL